MLKLMFLAGLGGFFGSTLRFLSGRYFQHVASDAIFPWATFSVNILVSLIIGVLYGLGERYNVITPQTSALLITGFCGGFTTFSSFSNDIYLILNQREWGVGLLYILLSVILGIAMVMVGREVVR